jgi:hypothetical protein
LGASSLQGHLSGDHQFGFDEMALKALMVREPINVSAVFPLCGLCVSVHVHTLNTHTQSRVKSCISDSRGLKHNSTCLQVKAGFAEAAVKRCTYQQSLFPALRVDDVSEAAAVKMAAHTPLPQESSLPTYSHIHPDPLSESIYLSLFMEATKSLTPIPSSGPAHECSSSSPSFSSSSASSSSQKRGGRLRRGLQWLVKRIFASIP